MDKKDTSSLGGATSDVAALEAMKTKLIEEARVIYRKLDYKKFEKNALTPYVKEMKDAVDTRRLRRIKRELEFKISTQAFTAKTEKAIIKQIKSVDAKLKKLIRKERILRKYNLVIKDIEELTREAENKEKEIKEIKQKLKEIYSKNKGEGKRRRGKDKSGKNIGKNENEEVLVSLEDLIGKRK